MALAVGPPQLEQVVDEVSTTTRSRAGASPTARAQPRGTRAVRGSAPPRRSPGRPVLSASLSASVSSSSTPSPNTCESPTTTISRLCGGSGPVGPAITAGVGVNRRPRIAAQLEPHRRARLQPHPELRIFHIKIHVRKCPLVARPECALRGRQLEPEPRHDPAPRSVADAGDDRQRTSVRADLEAWAEAARTFDAARTPHLSTATADPRAARRRARCPSLLLRAIHRRDRLALRRHPPRRS